MVRFKTDNNRWFTKALFWDVASMLNMDDRQDFQAPFTLYDPRQGYTCFRTTFVELEDPTGYEWAMQYLGDWTHWTTLCKCKWFQEALLVAQEELAQRLKAQALRRVREIAGEPSAQALVAAKYLAERGWEKRAGRPTKAQMDKELKEQVQVLEAESDDMERIGLKVIKGGKVG